MASPRVFSMIALLAPHLKLTAARNSSTSGAARAVYEAATSRKQRMSYKTWAELWGANSANAHAAAVRNAASRTLASNARAQKKSGFVSTLFKRHSKSSNLSRSTIQKQMSYRAGSASKKARRKSAKLSHVTKSGSGPVVERVDMSNNCLLNYENASHALVLARLNNTVKRAQFGTEVSSDLTTNIGVFLKGYSSRNQSGPMISFADHVKQAQKQILVPPSRLDCATQKMGVSCKAASTGFNANKKLFHVPKQKLDVTASSTVSTTAPASAAVKAKPKAEIPKAPKNARPLTTATPPAAAAPISKHALAAPHREVTIKHNTPQRRAQHQQHGADAKISYQPSRLPTMRTLMKEYKDLNHDEVLNARMNKRIPRADDGKKIYTKRQLPQINMNDKCPMDDFIIQKTRPGIRHGDTAQSFRS